LFYAIGLLRLITTGRSSSIISLVKLKIIKTNSSNNKKINFFTRSINLIANAVMMVQKKYRYLFEFKIRHIDNN